MADPIELVGLLLDHPEEALAAAQRLVSSHVKNSDDSALQRLERQTAPRVNLGAPMHREAVLDFLRSWRVRGIPAHDLAAERAAEDQLGTWWEGGGRRAFDLDSPLWEMDDRAILETAGEFFRSARQDIMCRMRSGIALPLGPTGASKLLWLLAPETFAPWDRAIRADLGFGENELAYQRYLSFVRDCITSLSGAANCEPRLLPARLGLAAGSAPKAIDTLFYWWLTRDEPLLG